MNGFHVDVVPILDYLTGEKTLITSRPLDQFDIASIEPCQRIVREWFRHRRSFFGLGIRLTLLFSNLCSMNGFIPFIVMQFKDSPPAVALHKRFKALHSIATNNSHYARNLRCLVFFSASLRSLFTTD